MTAAMLPTPFERQLLAAWRNGGPAPLEIPTAEDPAAWVPLVLHYALVASRTIRTARLGDLEGGTVLKGDGSPVTALERLIEEQISQEIGRRRIPVALLGEETAPGRPGNGMTLAVDPVDGTWSLVNRTETVATSLALLRDGEVIVGVIANPATAELAYAAKGQPSRLLQLGAFGEGDRSVELPLPPAGPGGLLVSLHPQRAAGAIVDTLARAWAAGELDMVRAPGGAPSLGLLEAAKGNFVYVNLWNRRETAAWDLSAGLLLVRGAGGDVVDLAGHPVRTVGHRGPLIAALRKEDRHRVAQLIRSAPTSRSA